MSCTARIKHFLLLLFQGSKENKRNGIFKRSFTLLFSMAPFVLLLIGSQIPQEPRGRSSYIPICNNMIG